ADISDGEVFPPKLAEAILGAKLFVALVDDAYFTSWFCLRELRTALAPFDELSQKPGISEDQLHKVLSHVIIGLPDKAESRLLENLPPQVRTRSWPIGTETSRITDLIRLLLNQVSGSIGELLATSNTKAKALLLYEESALPPPQPLVR